MGNLRRPDRRQREVMRLSIVRHAFRRPLELWLLLDMAVFLEEQGWQAQTPVEERVLALVKKSGHKRMAAPSLLTERPG